MRFSDIQETPPNLQGAGLNIAIVMSRFNPDTCEGLLSSCKAELNHLGVHSSDIHLYTVPGALEIPFILQTLAKTKRFHALVALGAVIRGETYHFELVSNESGSGINRIGLDYDIPIANAVLTTEDDDQAHARMHEKGAEAARVAVEMARLQQSIRLQDALQSAIQSLENEDKTA